MPAVAPTALIQNYVFLAATTAAPSDGLFIPLASLTGLTSAEANASTGDGRKVVFEILKEVLEQYTALATASRPNKLTITRAVPTGVDAASIRQSYTFSFDLDIAIADLAAEV